MLSTATLSDSFNPFLFATVCEGRDENPVSVISALARLDLDPWTEAAKLASMPAVGATERLSSLLASVAPQPDRETIVARLVALLPPPARANVTPGTRELNTFGASYLQCLGVMWLIILASMAVSAWIAPAPAGGAHVPAAMPAPKVATGR